MKKIFVIKEEEELKREACQLLNDLIEANKYLEEVEEYRKKHLGGVQINLI